MGIFRVQILQIPEFHLECPVLGFQDNFHRMSPNFPKNRTFYHFMTFYQLYHSDFIYYSVVKTIKSH